MNDTIGNRLYLAYGVGDDGVLQVLDRRAAAAAALRHGSSTAIPTIRANAELEAPQTSILWMSPDQGGHTSFPVFGMKPRSYEDFTDFKTRDIVVLASESTADKCEEAPHWTFIVDITVENSKSAPPGTRVQQNVWQGPMVLSTIWVDPRAGEKYPRGNYCKRGARYGVHSSEENFTQPVLRPADVHRLLHRRRARLGHPRAAGPGRGRVLRAGEQRPYRDPRRLHDQQPGSRRPRLHPGGRSQRRGFGHSTADRKGARHRLPGGTATQIAGWVTDTGHARVACPCVLLSCIVRAAL